MNTCLSFSLLGEISPLPPPPPPIDPDDAYDVPPVASSSKPGVPSWVPEIYDEKGVVFKRHSVSWIYCNTFRQQFTFY